MGFLTCGQHCTWVLCVEDGVVWGNYNVQCLSHKGYVILWFRSGGWGREATPTE